MIEGSTVMSTDEGESERVSAEKQSSTVHETGSVKERHNKFVSGANQTSNMGKIYQVIVNGLKGEKISIDLGHSEEEMNNLIVLELKKKIAAKLPGNSGDDVTRIRLVFTDKMLDDSNTLSSYGIQDKSVIQMVIQLPGGGHSVQMDL
uniref:Ubiquitin-like domain-containing protein n=1 Tax=Scleropages formosus TaxID=113540 RepID=A0A8C9RDB4_SCLFO